MVEKFDIYTIETGCSKNGKYYFTIKEDGMMIGLESFGYITARERDKELEIHKGLLKQGRTLYFCATVNKGNPQI